MTIFRPCQAPSWPASRVSFSGDNLSSIAAESIRWTDYLEVVMVNVMHSSALEYPLQCICDNGEVSGVERSPKGRTASM